MKPLNYLLVAIAAMFLAGCGGSGGGGASVDTSSFEKSFAAAESSIKGAADKAVTAVKGADFKPAIEELQKLAANVKLTDEQKQAINDLIAKAQKAQKALTDAAGKVSEGATKAVGDVQKALGK